MSSLQNENYRIMLQGQGHTTNEHDGGVHVFRVDLEAPWRWLSAGWSDLLAIPQISLTYGAVFAVIALGFWFGLASVGWQALMLVLAGGFMLIGPILGVGLYEASRRLELGQKPGFRDVIFAGFKASDQLSLLGLALLLIYVIWVQLALLLFMIFFGPTPFPPLEYFIPNLLFTGHGLSLLIVGTIVGAALAAIVFAISVISAPMLLARPVSVITAISVSLRATICNIKPMILWAALIVGFLAIGLATLCVGLIIIFPLIGHATWHAYRDVLDQKVS